MSLGLTDYGPLPAPVIEAINRPIGQAKGLPNEAYTSPEFARYERDHLLAKTWVCAGFATDIGTTGDALPIQIMGQPLFIVRNPENQINVFHNVCRHRGQRLLSEPCHLKGSIRCPYHSWTYSLDGELRGTPHIGGPGVHEVEGFDKSKTGLIAVRSEVWQGIIFINMSGDAAPFSNHIDLLRQRWKPYWGATEGANLVPDTEDGCWDLTVQSNWKLAVENYCESYHLPWVHPGLNRYSRLEDHYQIIEHGHFAGQGSIVYNPDFGDRTPMPHFDAWPEDKFRHAEYTAMFPNVLLGLQRDHFFAIALIPINHEQTVERIQISYIGEAANDETHRDTRRAIRVTWQEVFGEDVWAVEGLQQGRHSPGFDGGTFSPVMDGPTLCFHQWVANRLSE